MPDSNEEAVCGTCGDEIRLLAVGTKYERWAHLSGGHKASPPIPAPVVPSDDDDCERCEHAGHGEDACEVTVSYGAGVPGLCGCASSVVPSDEREERTMNLPEAIEIVNRAVNKNDATDCEACAEIETPCPYHDGVEAGARWVGDVVKRAVDDPESVAMPRG